MNKIEETIKEIKEQLDNIQYLDICDLSDLGNEIGIVIGRTVQNNEDKLGYEVDDFLNGFKHGISLRDGTH